MQDPHIEKLLLCIIGQLIAGSGLGEIFTLHKFLTISLSYASYIKRAHYAIQVKVCDLSLKLQEASVKDGWNLHPFSWLVKKSTTNRMCFIWKVILDLEIQILIFVQSHQEGNFQLN